MTHRQGDVLVISGEADKTCELCGKVAECRPYGPNSEQICFECGMKNEPVTRQKFEERLDGGPT